MIGASGIQAAIGASDDVYKPGVHGEVIARLFMIGNDITYGISNIQHGISNVQVVSYLNIGGCCGLWWKTDDRRSGTEDRGPEYEYPTSNKEYPMFRCW